MYFIIKGDIEFYINYGKNNYYKIETRHKGDIFGTTSFFSGLSTKKGAKTKDMVELAYVTKESFL